MRGTAGADECAAGNKDIFRRHDHTESIAGRIEPAPVDHHVMPISAGHAVIAGRKIALTDIDIIPSSDVDAVPAAGNPEAIELAVSQFVAENCVIRGIVNADSRHLETGCFSDKHSVRPAHSLFAERIANAAAVNSAGPGNGRSVSTISYDKGL